MHPVMQAVAQQRIQESALMLWQVLEQQRPGKVDWHTLEAMHPALAGIAPLRRKLVQTKNAEGLRLLNAYRVFDPELAQRLLDTVEFSDMLEHLQRHGYERTKQAFIAKCEAYARAQESLIYYAR